MKEMIMQVIIIICGFGIMLGVLIKTHNLTKEVIELKLKNTGMELYEITKEQKWATKIAIQQIECEKCYCKRKPYVRKETLKYIPDFLTKDVLCIDCNYKCQNEKTQICFAKDKKYIETKIKEKQNAERKNVLG